MSQRPGEAEAVEALSRNLDCYDTVMNVRAEACGAVAVAYPLIARAVEVLAYERAAEAIRAKADRMSPNEPADYIDGLLDAASLAQGLVVSPVEEGKQR